MTSKYVSVDGEWTVEVIMLEKAGPARQCLRVRRFGYLVAYCATIEEVAKHVDLSLLRPAD